MTACVRARHPWGVGTLTVWAATRVITSGLSFIACPRAPTPPGPSATALGDAHLRRALHRRRATRSTGATWPRARPGCPSPSTCPPRPATTPTTRWPAARSARSACRSRHLGDMRALFDGIPLREMNTSMTINATAMWLLALYQVAAERAGGGVGEDPAQRVRALAGTTQNDIIKEYLSRGTYVFPPAPSLRLTTDMIAYTVARDPEVEPDQHLQLPPAGGRRDAGAGARLRAVAPRSPCSTRCATRARCRRAVRRRGRAHLVLRQRRRAVRRGDVQDARVRRSSGTS